MRVMADLGFRPIRSSGGPAGSRRGGSASRRGKLSQCVFDKTGLTDRGLQRLKAYREGVGRHSRRLERPSRCHDEASHAASAFMTFTSSNYHPHVFEAGCPLCEVSEVGQKLDGSVGEKDGYA